MDEPPIGQVRSMRMPCQSAVYTWQTWAISTWTGSWLDEPPRVTRSPVRNPARLFFTEEGKRLQLKAVLPQRVGQTKEMPVLVGIKQRHPMRLLMLRVPPEVAEQRRARLLADASRLQKPVSAQALELTKWLLLLTDAPAKRLSLQEAIVLQRERWQIEILYKLWKQYGQIDEWRTANTWRILCELYAKLIGVLLQHWLIVLFAWQDEQRSLVKLAQVIRDGSLSFIEALAGYRSLHTACKS